MKTMILNAFGTITEGAVKEGKCRKRYHLRHHVEGV